MELLRTVRLNTELKTMLDEAVGVGADGRPKSPSAETLALLQERRFDSTAPPPKIRPVYSLNGIVIATPGNLVAITAGIKTGKTAVIGAMAASPMTKSHTADMLGFTSTNPKAFGLLHFDTEQSRDDHWRQGNCILKRAGLSDRPPWFHSYCLTGLDFGQALECIREAIQQARKAHEGIHSVLLDGVADLVPDVNDPSYSNRFVAELHALAIDLDCPIIGAMHFNPGGDKLRGHLGSQLERKAETNLRLDKAADGVTTIWSDKQRRAPIPKSTGPCFQWNDKASMHVTVKTRQASKEEAEKEELTVLAEEVFAGRAAMRSSELQATVRISLKVSPSTAERKVRRMRQLRVIKKTAAGFYTLAT